MSSEPSPDRIARMQIESGAMLAQWMMESGEQVLRVQLDAAREAFDASVAQLHEALAADTPESFAAVRARMLQSESARVLATAERYFALSMQRREALARLMDESFAAAAAASGGAAAAAARPLADQYRDGLAAARALQSGLAELADQSNALIRSHYEAVQAALARALGPGGGEDRGA